MEPEDKAAARERERIALRTLGVRALASAATVAGAFLALGLSLFFILWLALPVGLVAAALARSWVVAWAALAAWGTALLLVSVGR
ncbi:MAG: hypothetical protein ACK47B_29045 [Armatimonadota bacterium]